MATVDARIATLWEFLKSRSTEETVFISRAAQSTARTEIPLIISGNTGHLPMTGGALYFTLTRWKELTRCPSPFIR